MEFLYRAVDERRSRSPPPPPPAAPSTPGSGSADGDGPAPAERVGNSAAALALWQQPDLPAPPEDAAAAAAAVDADELRRQAEKARIRERILREEAEHRELELEVRSELREQMMLQLSWPAALGRQPAKGSGTPPSVSPGTITTAAGANSSPPVVALEADPKASALATAPTKRKSPGHAAGTSTVSLPPSSKKQKSTSSTCTVCGITANSEKAMQDHLNGKVHRKKVVALPELRPKLVPDETVLEAGEEEAMAMETLLGGYKPAKFMMATNAGVLNEVTQMDGYLLCELCGVETADRVTMMCHLQGSKHISNDQKKRQPSSKPSSGAAIAGDDPNKKLVLEDCSVPLPHVVRRLEGGFLLCELCDVKAPSMNGMHQHLSGKKHRNKANTSSSDASASQAKVEAPVAKLGDDSELQEMTMAPPTEDAVPIGDSTDEAPGTEMVKNSATSTGIQLNNVSDSDDSLTMEVDSVMHPLRRVDGFLVCLCCNAKAPSEITMQSHLAGKKHKRKMTLAAARGNNDHSSNAGADGNSSKSTKGNTEAELAAPRAETAANEEAQSALSLAVPQMKNTAAMESMAVDQPIEAQLAACTTELADECEIAEEAEGEHAAVDSNGAVTQAKESESMGTADETTTPAKPIKIQVEGKVFTVAQQKNGRLSCELCGVHGCDKDGMISHLYTSTHWGKARLAEKKEEQVCMAAAAMVDKDGEVGSIAGEAQA